MPICREIIEDASAWTAASLRERDWLIELTAEQAAELHAATAAVADRELTDLDRADFPLPLTGSLLADLVRELEFGRGFAVVRGIPVAGLAEPALERLFVGLGVHLGQITAQTRSGEILNHVRDVGADSTARGYTSKYGLPFHTDGTDLLALLCVTPAVEGGRSSVSSAVSVHNRVLRERPELLGLLYKEYLYDKRGAQAEGESPFYANQIFGYFDGKLACRYYNRGRVESAQEVSGIRLSDAERAALDAFEEFAASPELRLDVDLRAGDLMLIDNNVALHSRTEFTDSAEQRRHLMRLAINPREQRVFPDGFAKYREGYPVTAR
ncbi:Taurine dioxygenase, alpha-ketoglutarate-dependent [Actinokineospora alba]|uniref:Taurine dioxygenase, alpha-ketoglutarate-dependent n=1 Tax=Actinokineospora alba TaxID=504798 RepID=A0A1H0NJ08_9PSEU|nr:TauD/TfdA family dioxygenase [Actinokineospora alba]TDP68737.1 alpha-ketoglutarate-dependent taurine dioxygenase [Actinokineospora alba]SDH85532.1 Taurine dioxygenase, alpha-ketoglutarate-dependent [Actinokineospora alba]SDO92649.1 Taurine dioxygenase, alpha-ketoglutarate-dependent [Actinokineospora alba]